MKRAAVEQLLRAARATVRTVALPVAVLGGPVAALLAHHGDQVNLWAQDHVPALARLAATLPPVFAPQLMPATVAAVTLVALAVVCLGIVGSPAVDPPALTRESTGRPWAPVDGSTGPHRRRRWRLPLGLLTAAWLALLALLVASLLHAPGSALVVGAWLGLLAVAVLWAAAVDARYRRSGGPPALGRRGLALLGVLVLALTVWLASDLNSWRYSCIGDEWAVYERAASYVREGPLVPEHYFGSVSRGVYGIHAPFLSATQALVMSAAGTSNFGWRLSSVLALSLSVIPFVLFAGLLLGRSGLAVALAALCFSPLLFAEAHTGYGWGQMMLLTLAVLAALVWSLERCTMLGAVTVATLCVACSLIGGLAVFVAPLTLAVYAAVLWRRSASVASFDDVPARPSRARAGALVAVSGLVYVVAAQLPRWLMPGGRPLVAELRDILWRTSLGPLVAHYLGPDFLIERIQPASGPAEFLHTAAMMTVRAVLAPLTFRSTSHYVIGPVVDPIAGGLVMIGMAVTLLSAARRRRALLLWLFFVPAVVVAGTLAPYREYGDLRVTRLHFLVPFWALFAGFGYEAVAGALRARLPRGLCRVALALALAGVAAWGLWRIEVVSPARENLMYQTIAMRVLEESRPATRILACLDGWHPLDMVAPAYPGGERLGMVPEESFDDLLERGPRDDETFLFLLYQPPPERRARMTAFLQRYSAELRCTVFPRAGMPQVLSCTHAPEEGPSVAGEDGATSIARWLGS